MKTIKQNTTHKAVSYNGIIKLFIKGFEIGDVKCEDEFVQVVEYKDDLFAIFERLDEDNRINLAEFEAANVTL